MHISAAGGEAECSGQNSVANGVGHGDEFGRRGSLVRIGAPFAHHVGAQRCVRHLCGHVDCVLTTIERIEVLRERLPVPGESFGECRSGNVFDTFQHVDEIVVLFLGGNRRSESDPAVTHHDRGDTVDRRRGQDRVPGGLTVEVGVDVDETWCHHQTVGIDFSGPGAIDVRGHVGDAVTADGHVGPVPRGARPVDHHCVAYDQVVLAHVAILTDFWSDAFLEGDFDLGGEEPVPESHDLSHDD